MSLGMAEVKEPTTSRWYATIRLPFPYVLIVGGVLILVSYMYIPWKAHIHIRYQNFSWPTVDWKSAHKGQMHLAISVCGNRLEEGLVLLKSVALLTRSPFHVHIFTTDNLMAGFTKELNSWPAGFRKNMNYSLLPAQFPRVPNEKVWRNLFKPCASQRLFMPFILNHLDAVLYVDSDVLFLRPLDDIWRIFNDFNETQIAALVAEREALDAEWFRTHKTTPMVPPLGVNTAVILMNATRMRQVDWLSNITSLYTIHKSIIKIGDQDLANLYFSHFPERLHLIGCHWNFRSDHCTYKNNNTCESAKANGASLIHGIREIFHNDRQPLFRAVFQMLRDYRFTEAPGKFFSKRMLEIMLNCKDTKCEQVAKILLQQFHVNVARLEQESLEKNVSRQNLKQNT